MNKLPFLAAALRFAMVSATFLFLAFVALPWASTLPPVRARIELNNEKQVNGGATFYTDHAFLMDLLAERESHEN